MAIRKTPFANGEYYHVYNRGVDKQTIFTTQKHYQHFIDLLVFYRRHQSKRFSLLTDQERQSLILKNKGEPIVSIICYCLMPNHFHLVLQQLSDHGITNFMRRVGDGFSKYFNLKAKRVGPLFQGNFQAVHIDSNEQLLHISRYTHLNPLTSEISNSLEDYPWSSIHEYLKKSKGLCNHQIILDQFKSRAAYNQFILDYADYAKTLHRIKDLIADD